MSSFVPHFGCLILGLALSGCAQPSFETLYGSFLEPHVWTYHAHREGLGSVYDGRITMQSKPIDARHTKLEVHLLRNPNDPKSGGVQTYSLDFSSFPPRISDSSSTGGNAKLEPGFPLPNQSVQTGTGTATYASDRGILSSKILAFSWKYLPLEPDRLNNRLRFDLEFRSDYKLTNSNMRLEISARGIEHAQWKTSYGTNLDFDLESFN
jgi:hypothetical protein